MFLCVCTEFRWNEKGSFSLVHLSVLNFEQRSSLVRVDSVAMRAYTDPDHFFGLPIGGRGGGHAKVDFKI